MIARHKHFTRCFFALALALAACGDDVEEIDCDWIVGANCWKEFLRDVGSCGDHVSVGRLTADRLRCEYFDGTVVSFDAVFPNPVPGGYPWGFSVTTGGSLCLAHTDLRLEGGAGFRATAATGEFIMDNQRTALVFTCPDGSRHRLAAERATTCNPDHSPGVAVTTFPGGGAFFYNGATAGAEVIVFNCEL
ncbi:MAG: hypothetical protein E3J64_07030 [Anaerolineales bacterium]|nr:MAG: hypothetical protein E3J64_07030 [Anaerolineales bacterium]